MGRKQGYIIQVGRSGKEWGQRVISCNVLHGLCRVGGESDQSCTEKRFIHMHSARLCNLAHDFVLKLFSKDKKMFVRPLKSMLVNNSHG